MKTTVIVLALMSLGYFMGNVFPIIDFMSPKREIQFDTDFVIKAGQRATSRYFGTSLEPTDLAIEMTLNRQDFPKFKLIGSQTSQ